MSFSFVLGHPSQTWDAEALSIFWSHSIGTLVAIPALQELRIEFQLHACLTGDSAPDLFFPILNSLQWSLLDGLLDAARPQQLPLPRVRVAIWRRGRDMGTVGRCGEEMTWTEARHAELVRSKVCAAVRSILVFESLVDLPPSHPLRDHTCRLHP